ncbi:MAG: hypothetical protein EOL93_01730 [Epsilonproteobacteria bacterium]|nr:hypothetical protein [Campylobacterota bacterium]
MPLKIKKEHYEIMKQEFSFIIKDYVGGYNRLVADYAAMGCSENVLLWNVFGTIWKRRKVVYGHDFLSELYSYMNDSHIYNALRKIIKESFNEV